MDALSRHVALIGFMGSGKTTLGRELAERIGRPFYDLDWFIESRAGMTISELFRERGEAEFRRLEEEAASLLEAEPPEVIALGGGALGSHLTRERLRVHAPTLLVDADADTAWERVRDSDRPLAQDEATFRRL